jgi:hypothetical protein
MKGWYKWDLHVHNYGYDKPYSLARDIIRSAKERGLDGILLVNKYLDDNSKNIDPEELDRYREWIKDLAGEDLSVVFGHEVMTQEGDVIVIGYEPTKQMSLDELLVKSNSAGAGIIIPHPDLPMSGVKRSSLAGREDFYHGIEVFNSSVPLVMEFVLGINRNAEKSFGRDGLSYTCGTDNNHGEVGVGYCFTDKEIKSEEDFISVLKEGGFIPGTRFFSHGTGLLEGLYHNLRSSVKLITSILSGRHS